MFSSSLVLSLCVYIEQLKSLTVLAIYTSKLKLSQNWFVAFKICMLCECTCVCCSVCMRRVIFGETFVLELSNSFDASIYVHSAVGRNAKGRVRQLNGVNKGHFAYFLSSLLAPGKPIATAQPNAILLSGNFKGCPFSLSLFFLFWSPFRY